MKNQYLTIATALNTGLNLQELVVSGKAPIGAFTILYSGKYESLKCYKGGIILQDDTNIFPDNELIAPTKTPILWDVFYNSYSLRLIIQEENDLFVITEKEGKQPLLSLPEDIISWGLNESGVVLYKKDLKQLRYVEFIKSTEEILFTDEISLRCELGWQGAIIESKDTIFYCYAGHKVHLASKAEDNYTDWTTNFHAPFPSIIIETPEGLVYVQIKDDDGAIQYSLTNDYEDFVACKEGALIYYQHTWKYLHHKGDAVELPFLKTKGANIIPHPCGIVVMKKEEVMLIFL